MRDRRQVADEINRLIDKQMLALQANLRGEEAERYVERRQKIEALVEILATDNPNLLVAFGP